MSLVTGTLQELKGLFNVAGCHAALPAGTTRFVTGEERGMGCSGLRMFLNLMNLTSLMSLRVLQSYMR